MGRKKERKEKKKKKDGSTHHLIPRSRGGPEENWNTEDKPIEKHQAFHILSRYSITHDEMLPCELIDKVNNNWTKKSGELKKSELTEKQLKAWMTLFGEGASPETAIKIIKKEWVVKDGLTFKGCFKHRECFSTNSKRICPLLEMYKRGEVMI